MATIIYNRNSDTAATTLSNLTPAETFAKGMELYSEGLPDASFAKIVREVAYAARATVTHTIGQVHVQIRANCKESREIERIGAEKITARSVAFAAEMNKIANLDDRIDAIIATGDRW